MARVRVAVALLVPEPLAREVEGMRRACGDTMFGRVPAHLTLVPPVNVRVDDVPAALATLRVAAAATPGPIEFGLGPPTTFHPTTPVVYLAVDPVAEVVELRERLWSPPLARTQTWPFVAHVTLADEAPVERIAAMVDALADYRVEVAVEAVTLLQESPGRVWTPIADATFGPATVVARGGLEVELWSSTMLDPEATAALAIEGTGDTCITARRDGAILGAVVAREGEIVDLKVSPEAALEDIERHLLKALRHTRSS